MLLRLCGRIVAKGTYAENTFSPEKKKKINGREMEHLEVNERREAEAGEDFL